MTKMATSGPKLGRDKAISDDDLLKRYGALKNFLEWNWGRIGLKIQRVKKPSDVSSAIRLVRGVEWLPPFRDYKASCFANDGSGPVRFPEVRKTQRMHDEAIKIKERLWSEFHTSAQKLQSDQTSLKIAVSEIGALAPFFRVFYFLFAMGCCVQQMRQHTEAAQQALTEGQQREQELLKTKSAQEAWFAQNEIVKLRRSRRYEMNADNLAKAMAGAPEYGWLNSLRRCEKLNTESFRPPPWPYELFELLTSIVRRMKPLKVERIEARLRRELLSQSDPLLRECLKPHWADMKRAFADYRGEKFSRLELPYFLIGRLLEYMDSGKSYMESEIAKHAEAELTVTTSS